MDRPFNQYGAVFHLNDQAHLLQVKVAADVKKNRLKETVLAILNQEMSQDKNLPKEIALSCIAGKVFYSLDGQNLIECPEGEPVKAGALQIVKLTEKTFAKRKRSQMYGDFKSSLLSHKAAHVPAISLIWTYLLVPMTAALKALFGNRPLNLSSLKHFEDVKGRFALEHALSEVADLLQDDAEGGLIAANFSEALLFASRWRENRKPSLIDEMVATLNQRIGEADNPSSPLLSFPAGMWKDTFEPSFFSFYLNGEGNLTLSEMSYSETDGAKTRHFNCAGIEAENLKRLIASLLTLADPPQKEEESDLSNPLSYIVQQDMMRGSLASEPLLEFLQDTPEGPVSTLEGFKEKLFSAVGAVALPKPESGTSFIRKHPMKIVQAAIQEQFLDVPLQNKALFSLQLIYGRLNAVLDALPQMNREEKELHLHRLQQDYQSLERQFAKSGIGQEELESAFSTLQSNMQKLQRALQELEGEELMARLNKAPSTPYRLRVEAPKESCEGLENRKNQGLSKADYETILILKDAFLRVKNGEGDAIETLNGALKQANERIDSLIEGGQNALAELLSRQLLQLIPMPDDAENLEQVEEPSFWDTLAQTDAIRSRSDQIQAFSDQIALANHHFWEAKAKGGLERLKIDEPIHLLNSSAALLQTMQLRARLLSQLEEEDLTFEEEGFLAVAAAYRHLSTLTAINLLKNDYLRPLENASLALKYDRCLRYFRQFDKEQYSDAIHERLYYQKVLAFRRDRYNDYVELNCCGALLQVADKRGLSQDDRPMWQREALLWERLLDRHSQEAIAMPSQIAHIVRQEYIMFSLIYHESAIALPAHSLLEHLKGIRQLKQASGNEEKRSNLAQGNFAAVQKRLKQLGRLEIANQASFKATDLPDVIEPSKAIPSPQPPAKEIAKGPFRTGVLPRGAKANRPLDLEITREEAAGLQRGLMNPDEYQKRGSDLLGHPNEEVFGKKVSSWRSNFSGESEMTHLQQALTSNHPSPLDLFFLKSLDGGEQMNVQEVFNLLLQRPSLLGFKMENALGETALEGQKRFYEVLFQLDRKGDTFLIRALKKSPEYFLSHEKALRHLLEQHLHEEKEESFFLLFLLLSVHAQAKKAELAWPIENVERQKGEPLVQRQALKTVVDTWPSLESEYLKQALALLQKKGDLKTLVDASASITSLLAQQIDFANPEELPLELSTLAGLLRMGSILEQAQQEASLPILAMQGLIWVKEQLVPYIAQLEEEEKEEIFNLWAGLEGIETSDSHWHESADALSWQKGDAIVDLSALRVFQKGQPEKGILTSLPLEIVNHPNYRSAYGREKFLAHSTASKQPGTYLYTFKKGSLTHRITYNHFSKEITIERALLTESKKAQWERFSSFLLPKETESASWFSRLAHSWTGKSVIRPLLHRQKKENADALFSAEKMLSEAGVWLQPGGKEGTSNLRLGNQELRLLFDSGKVSSVLTADGLQVVFDGQRELASTLSCLPDSQMLFLKKPGAKWVQEIRFLGHALSLKRSCATDPWVLFGDSQLEGDWQWVQQRQRNDFAKEMLQGLGSIEKTGFTLQQGERISLFLWPQDGEEIQKSPPLKVYLEEGQVRASAAGYLHLAYLSAQEKEYKKALSYLKNAQKTKLSHSSELQAIAQIHTLFEQMPATSVRSTSCKIKGLLAARRILKEQGYHYQEANWSSFLSAEELKKTFALYQECLQTSSFKKKGDFIDSEAEVALTLDEIEQLKSLAKEAFSDLVAEKSALPPPNLDLHLKAVSQLEIQQALPLLLAKAKVPKDKTALRTFKLDDSIVEHFFERYQQILEKKLKPQDLLPLFAPLPEGSKQQRALLDIARRMLLSAASLPDQEADVFIDLKEIRKLHSSLPKNSYSLFFSLKYDLLKAMIRKKAGDSFLEASRALLNKLERAIGAGSRTGAEGPLEITPSGFQASKRESDPSPADGLLNQLQKNRYLSVEKIASFLQEEKVFLGPIRQMRLLEALASETFQRLTEETAGVIPLEKVVSFFEAECQFNLLSIMREKEVQERIELLEEELKEVISPVHHPLFFIEKALASPLEGKLLSAGSKLWQRAESLQETLDDLQSDLSKHLSPGPLLEGIQEAEKALSQRKRFSLKREDLAALVQAIDEEMAYSKMRLSSNQKILFHYLRNAELPENVQRALKQVPEIGNEEVLKLLKEEYQKGSLDQTTNQLLTIHLLEKTAYTILSIEVQRQLQELKALQAEGALESSDAWIHSVSKVKNLVSKALSFDRYFQNNSDGQWQLKNESLYRKIIVTEAHLGIILSDAQIDLIEKMVENPSAWYELKVGLGKTSVVLPLVLLQLIEKGERPTALVKEELLQQNLDSLDLSTRELLAKAGIHFSFRLNAPISAASLEEEYLRLLECAKNGGYPITSASSLIDIDHKLSLLERALQEEEKRLASLPPLDLEDMSDETEETLSSRLNLEELQKQLHYLLKIRSYFDLLLVDEADDVLKITSERNVSLGEPAPLNQTIQETLHHLMRQVFTAEDPTIQLFRRALQEGQQAALSLTFLEETLLPSLVDALLKDAAYRQFLLVDLETDLTPFIDYISKVFSPEDTPPQSSLSPEIQKKLGALKHLVQSTLKTTIRQNPGIDVGLKKSDGFQIGPQVSGQEKLGTVFGDEYDLLANHYLYYGMHLPERGATQAPGEGFVEKALRQIQSQHPQTYRRWQELAQGQDLVSFLNEPEQFELRLDFLRLELLQEQRLQLFPRQMVYNVQDISYGRRIGGMTGTLNSNALPPINGQAEESAPKIVPGQVILEVGLLGVPQVSSMSDEEVKVLETMALAAENGKNKALINQGFALKEGSSQDVVAFIRKRAKERIFVFVDAEDRRPRIWYPKDKEPQPISKGELNRLAGKKEFKELACFYFAPPDTRGTDFRIPAGNGVAFISPKCSLDDFIQSVGRMRGAAEIHRLDFFVSEGACQRMGKEPLSYGALISDIDQQNNELEKNENLKTACEHLKRIGKMGSRHLCFNLQSSHIRQQLQAAIADPKIGWLEEQKGHAFAFSPSIYEPVEVMAERIYKAEVKKFQKLKEAIENLTLPEEAAEGPLSLGELKKVLIESYYHLEEELKEAYEQLLAKLQQEGGQTFHKMVPSSGANLPNAHAQVQEVVQQNNLAQQQMQQLQTQKTERIRALPFASSNPANRLEYVPPAAFLEYHPDPGSLPVPEISNFLEQAFQFEGLESFTVSSKLLRLIFQLGGAKGNLSLCYIGVFMDEIHLMSRENYLTSHVGSFHDIYSLVNPLTYGESLLLDQTRFKVDGHRKDDPYPLREDMLVHIVQAKWFLGAVDYTEEELKRLKPFLREIAADEQLQNGHWLFLEHFGSQEQRQLLSQLL